MDCVGQVVGVVGQEVVATGHWVVTAVAGHWVAVAGQTVTVPVGQTIDRVAIAYDLDSSNINPAATFTARMDDLTLTSTTATTTLSWREDTH